MKKDNVAIDYALHVATTLRSLRQQPPLCVMELGHMQLIDDDVEKTPPPQTTT